MELLVDVDLPMGLVFECSQQCTLFYHFTCFENKRKKLGVNGTWKNMVAGCPTNGCTGLAVSITQLSYEKDNNHFWHLESTDMIQLHKLQAALPGAHRHLTTDQQQTQCFTKKKRQPLQTQNSLEQNHSRSESPARSEKEERKMSVSSSQSSYKTGSRDDRIKHKSAQNEPLDQSYIMQKLQDENASLLEQLQHQSEQSQKKSNELKIVTKQSVQLQDKLQIAERTMADMEARLDLNLNNYRISKSRKMTRAPSDYNVSTIFDKGSIISTTFGLTDLVAQASSRSSTSVDKDKIVKELKRKLSEHESKLQLINEQKELLSAVAQANEQRAQNAEIQYMQLRCDTSNNSYNENITSCSSNIQFASEALKLLNEKKDHLGDRFMMQSEQFERYIQDAHECKTKLREQQQAINKQFCDCLRELRSGMSLQETHHIVQMEMVMPPALPDLSVNVQTQIKHESDTTEVQNARPTPTTSDTSTQSAHINRNQAQCSSSAPQANATSKPSRLDEIVTECLKQLEQNEIHDENRDSIKRFVGKHWKNELTKLKAEKIVPNGLLLSSRLVKQLMVHKQNYISRCNRASSSSSNSTNISFTSSSTTNLNHNVYRSPSPAESALTTQTNLEVACLICMEECEPDTLLFCPRQACHKLICKPCLTSWFSEAEYGKRQCPYCQHPWLLDDQYPPLQR